MGDDFNLGDVVALKSGGPVMTVDRIKPGGRIRCVYINRETQSLEAVEANSHVLKKSGKE